MSALDPIEAKYMSRLVRVAATLKDVESKLEALRREKTEAIALIGIGCRFPGGADDPESFWRLLDDEVDAVSEVPAERLTLDPGSLSSEEDAARWGAFLKDIDGFDAQFFGISQREATHLDP